MSGEVSSTFSVRAVYHDPWTDDDVRRLVVRPVEEEMYEACARIAEKYTTPAVTIGIV